MRLLRLSLYISGERRIVLERSSVAWNGLIHAHSAKRAQRAAVIVFKDKIIAKMQRTLGIQRMG